MLASYSGGRRMMAVTLSGIAALGCGSSDTTGPNHSRTGVAVTGAVVDECLAPVPQIRVWVRGGESVYTDENGAFRIEGVSRPFDIAYIYNGGNFDRVRIFAGVTRTSLRLVLPEFRGGHVATVTGTLTGRDLLFPVPNLEQVMVGYAGGQGRVNATTTLDPSYSVQANWCGPVQDAGTSFALQWMPGFGRPPAYRAFGAIEGVAVEADGLTTDHEIPTATIPTGGVRGSVTLPPGFAVTRKSYGLGLGGAAVIDELGRDEGADLAFDLPVPEIPGGTISLAIEAQGEGFRTSIGRRHGLAPGATDVTIPLALPPVLATPENDVTVDPAGLEFGWSASPVGLYGLFLGIAPVRGDRTTFYQIYSAAPTASLPPADSLPIPEIPAGWFGGWRVVAFSEPSVDALLDPASPVAFAGEPNLPYTASTGRPLTEVRSETRFFKTR